MRQPTNPVTQLMQAELSWTSIGMSYKQEFGFSEQNKSNETRTHATQRLTISSDNVHNLVQLMVQPKEKHHCLDSTSGVIRLPV